MLVAKNKVMIAVGCVFLSVNIYAMDITQRLRNSLVTHYT